jgi:sugar phosphate isomerase/epimerase
VTVHTGVRNPLLDDSQIDEFLSESLSLLNDAAEKNNVMIGVEVADYFYCPKRFEIIESLALSNVGITLDIGHLCFPQSELEDRPGFSQYGSIEGVIRRYADLIKHVHIHDFSFARNKDHLGFGDGNLDMISIVNSLRNNGYNGTLLMEMTPLVSMEKIISGKELLEKITAKF